MSTAATAAGYHARIIYPSGCSIWISDLPGSFTHDAESAHVHPTSESAHAAMDAALRHFEIRDRSSLKIRIEPAQP